MNLKMTFSIYTDFIENAEKGYKQVHEEDLIKCKM